MLFISSDVKIVFPDSIDAKGQFEDFDIIQDVIKKLVSKVCRLDQERRRQLKNRKRNHLLNVINPKRVSNSKPSRQCTWFKRKYCQSTSFREQHRKRVTNHFRNKYQNNNNFREKQKKRIKTHIFKKYSNSSRFYNEYKVRSKKYIFNKYHTDRVFREKNNSRARKHILNKYYTNKIFRQEYKTRAKKRILDKYHTDTIFREKFKARANKHVLKRYNSDNSIRLKMIERSLNFYRTNRTFLRQNRRRLYNQNRRIMKKYNAFQGHNSSITHRNLYVNNLKAFRKLIREGPDYTQVDGSGKRILPEPGGNEIYSG